MTELDPKLVATFQSEVRGWQADVLTLLPIVLGVRTSISSQGYIMPHTGVGGKTISADRLHIGFEPNFPGGIERQVANARPTYMHENFHVAQKRNARKRGDPDVPPTAIEAAILEGGGTRFESLRAGSNPPWGNYDDEETMLELTKQMVALPADYDVQSWKFRHKETGRLWTSYKVGTFVTDKALRNANITIEQTAAMRPREILDLAAIL